MTEFVIYTMMGNGKESGYRRKFLKTWKKTTALFVSAVVSIIERLSYFFLMAFFSIYMQATQILDKKFYYFFVFGSRVQEDKVYRTSQLY